MVDDEARLRALLEAYLNGRGYHVVTAADGLEALQVAGRVRPDLIVLDARLPDISGRLFCEEVRHGDGGGDIPIMLLVESGADNDFAATCADDLVTKPFADAAFLHKIRHLLL